ncbi:hypothetical protein KBD18_00520, partial [Patescibacteria group bacterium]|nr:hypothetical protein [Patescibacteria group bacterium]
GSVRGIQVFVRVEFLLILLTISLALFHTFSEAAGATAEETGFPLLWHMLSTGTALCFGISLLSHEFGHATVARHYGIRTPSVTFFLFGGVLAIEDPVPSPKAEFLIAIAGPLVSAVISAVFAFISVCGVGLFTSDVTDHMDAIWIATRWLSKINLSMACFNMLPLFPMDGGRVVRAGLWWLHGDMLRATRFASWAARCIAICIMGCGAAIIWGVEIPFLPTSIFGGVWLILMAGLLERTARAEYRWTELRLLGLTQTP